MAIVKFTMIIINKFDEYPYHSKIQFVYSKKKIFGLNCSLIRAL